MKNILKLGSAIGMAVILLMTSSLNAQTTPIVGGGGGGGGSGTLYATNSEEWALALLNSPVDYYEGNYYFLAKFAEGKDDTEVRGEFRLESIKGLWMITRFTVGDEELKIDPSNPLPGFPRYQAEKITGFSIWADGYNQSGRVMRYMSFYSQLLRPDDSIQLHMKPNHAPILVAYQPPAGLDSKNLSLVVGNSQGYWDDIYGGFVIWLDLTRSYDSYQVIDTSRNVEVDSGAFVLINPTRGSTKSSGGNEIAIANEGQVQEVDLAHGSSSLYLQRQNAVSLLPKGDVGSTLPGKIYAIYVPVDSSLSIYARVQPGVVLEVWGFSNEGMKFLSWSGEKDGSIHIPDTIGYQGYKVVVWGESAEKLRNFTISFYWNTSSVSSGDGQATPAVEVK